MTDTTTNPAVAVELYQRMGGGLVPLLVRATDGDTTDVEALIAAAVAAHNADPEAHPDIRQAIEDAGGSGGGLVTTPVLTLAERLPIGFPATLGMAAIAGLNGAHVVSFSVTIGDAEPVVVDAADNAATYSFTPNGNEGDVVNVSVVAVDNFGNRSGAGTVSGVLYEGGPAIIAGDNDGSIYRSMDNGFTWKPAQPLELGPILILDVLPDGALIAGGKDGQLKRSPNRGLTWETSQSAGANTITVLFMTPDGCVLAGDNKGYVYRSSDSGLTWGTLQKITWDTIYSYACSMVAVSGGSILMGDCTGGLWRSTDKGITWKKLFTFPSKAIIYSIIMTPDGTLIAACGQSIYRSLNGGITWGMEQALGISYVRTLKCFSDGIIFAGADSGVRRSTDNGVTWEERQNLNSWDFLLTPDGDILAGSNNGVRRSTDNGVTWGALQKVGTSIRRLLYVTS